MGTPSLDTETRAQRQIRKAVEAKGAKTVKAEWTPIGPNVEMCGPEGGWEVLGEWPSGRLDDAGGYSVGEVLNWISTLWRSYVAGDHLVSDRSAYVVMQRNTCESLEILPGGIEEHAYLLRRISGWGPYWVIARAPWISEVFDLARWSDGQLAGREVWR